MPFVEFLDDLKSDDRQFRRYAKRCKTTTGYLDTHLRHARKVPSRERMHLMVQHSDGRLTIEDLTAHFYSNDQ